jgi:hypothetical protein
LYNGKLTHWTATTIHRASDEQVTFKLARGNISVVRGEDDTSAMSDEAIASAAGIDFDVVCQERTHTSVSLHTVTHKSAHAPEIVFPRSGFNAKRCRRAASAYFSCQVYQARRLDARVWKLGNHDVTGRKEAGLCGELDSIRWVAEQCMQATYLILTLALILTLDLALTL